MQLAIERVAAENDGEGEDVGTLDLVKRPDSYVDLRWNDMQSSGYCAGFGWQLGAEFVTPLDAEEGDAACVTKVQQRDLVYDPAKDVWTPN